MWAQLIKARLKEGKDGDLRRLEEEIGSVMGPASGFVRASTMRDQKDPSQYYTLVVFESEEKARAREQNPELRAIIGRISEMFQGPPEYVDLEVLREGSA